MDAYTNINKTDENLRNAIHKAYGKKCFYCGEKINMHQLQIDHIIPSSSKKNPNTIEMQAYLKELLDKGFIKDCIANYLPSCSYCNNQKSNKYFTVGNMRYFHEQTDRKISSVMKYMQKFKYADENPEKEKQIREISENRDYLFKRTILETANTCVYANGLGDVRVNSYLPVSLDDKLSCLILFKQEGLTDCIFLFDEDDIKSRFFQGYNTGKTTKRKFISYLNNDIVGINFLNNRFETDYKTVDQLCRIVDDIYVEYYTRKDQLLVTIGATYFEEIDDGEFSILRMPKDKWIEMVDFAQSHDYYIGNTEWDIFQPLHLSSKNHIMIYRNQLNKINADVLAQLYVNDLSGDYVEVFWKAGFTEYLRTMDGFDNIHKWKADYTHNWVLSEFIPYTLYLKTIENKSVLQRIFSYRISFEDFKKSFNYSNYGIISLKLNG